MKNPAPSFSARTLALLCLGEWHSSQQFADGIFARQTRERPLEPSDQAFARELFYGVLRNLTALDFLLKGFIQRPPSPDVLNALRLGIYQLFIIDTAEHAALNETVELVATHTRGFINAVLRGALRSKTALQEKLRQQQPSVRFSHPAGLLRRWTSQWGESAAQRLAEWNNTPAEVFIRVNTLLISRDDLLKEHPQLVPLPHSLCFKSAGPLPTGPAARLIYVQDPATLAAPELLAPSPGEHLLDACAAPGGKTTYLAAMMKNQGEIVATDSSFQRIEQLEANIRNLGVTNTRIGQHDWETGSGSLAGQTFDAILADVPCSNTGVMRRRIDVRWRLHENIFAEFAQRQRQLVENLLPHVRPGGRLIYSTCSLEPEENEGVVQAVLREHPEFQMTREIRKLPHVDGCDGSYAARLERSR